MTTLGRSRDADASLRNPAAWWQRWSEAAAPAPDTPTGRGAPLPRLPALDGLRGVAVIGVLLFHGGFSWATGGFLGVSTFFTLSGFLITNLLVREYDRTHTIRLGTFWSRRFRRLLPAALAALVLIALYGQLYASAEQLRDLRGDVFAALAYVENWRLLFEGKSYADLFSAPSPVQHFWSLSIEEQFYVFFPALVYLSLRFGGRRLLTGVLVVAAVASVVASFALAESVDHVYYGTDTRAFELLAGALLAIWWSGRTVDTPARIGSWPRAAFDALAVVALAATVWSWTFADETSEALGRGGLALHALSVVVVIAAIVRRSVLATVLSFAPLRWAGLISYGLYLYHWPVFLALSPERTKLDTTPLFLLRMAVTLAIALVSYYLLEQPIRHRHVLRAPRRVALAGVGGLAAVVIATVAVTADPPASKIPYADADIDDFQPVVIENTSVPPPTTTAAPEATEPPLPPVPVPETVMIVGDSGMADAAPAMVAMLQAAGVPRAIDAAAPGFGLSADGRIDWWRTLTTEHNPDLVIVMLGGWDLQFLEDRGDAAYLQVVEDAVAALTSGGARVLWLSMLPGGDTPQRGVDRVYELLPALHPGVVEYWDIEAAFRGPNGDWPRAVTLPDGSTSLWRKPDDWHLCPDGAERLAIEVSKRLVALRWMPAESAPWHDGDWRLHPRYDDPPGGCVVDG